MYEKDIEKAVCEYARKKDFLAYKFVSPAHMAVPDRLFITPKGNCFFIEFKAPGKHATPQQLREHNRLLVHFMDVHVVDDVLRGMEIIDRYADEEQ